MKDRSELAVRYILLNLNPIYQGGTVGKVLSFKKAAKKILENSNKPLPAREIVELALAEGLIKTEGKTPEATMAAQLYMDIRDNPKSEFMKVSAGTFALVDGKDTFSGEQHVARHNQQVREQLKQQLHEMDPGHFESLIAALLDKIGFEDVDVVGGTSDGGIDVTAALTVGGITNVRTVIQAKRYKNNVSSKVIRELRGSAELTLRGLVITTAGFTKDAIEEAEQPNKMPITLVDGEKLLDLLIRHQVGVKKANVDILSIDEEFTETLPEISQKMNGDPRSNAIWPLPGGTNSYRDTLNKFLEYVDIKRPTKSDATQWFLTEFDTVNSEKTAGGYVNVPRMLHLLARAGDHVVLTDEGKAYLSDPTPAALKTVLERSLVGVSEILEVLEEKPLSEKEIWEYLVDALNLNWKSPAQPKWRLLWLMNAEAITKNSQGKFQLKGIKN